MAKTPGKEVTVTNHELPVSIGEARARKLLTQAVQEMARPEQSALEMAVSIMDAASDEAVFGSTVLHLQDMIGEPFTINRAFLAESEYTDGLPAFTVMECTLDDGSHAVVTTGAVNVVAAVINFHMRGRFPIRVNTSTDTTKAGFTVVKLVKPTTEQPTQAQLTDF